MQGAYENYLSIKFKDVKMQNVSNMVLYEYVSEWHFLMGYAAALAQKS